jgi:hypothetical protein
MDKGERISRFIEELEGIAPADAAGEIAQHPCYRGFFRCWNEQRYYEAHDVLEHLWLDTKSEDSKYFKGLIQAAGGFVHLQKQFEHPTHPKHWPPAQSLRCGCSRWPRRTWSLSVPSGTALMSMVCAP